MEETISGWMVLIGLASMLLTAVLVSVMFTRTLGDQLVQDLGRQTQVLAAALELSGGGAAELAEMTAGGDVRATLLDEQDNVLYDSQGDDLDNHGDRPEVIQARAEGTGSSRRTSSTFGVNTYYYAMLLEDGRVLRLAAESSELHALYDQAVPAIALALIGVLFFAVAASLLLTRRLVRPIEQMGRNLDDLTAHVPYRELKPFARALEQDRRALREGEQMRQEFTANVSHELKTPLTSISGYAELIENGIAQPADIPVFAGRIRTEAGRLLTLIRDILELSRLDQPMADPQFEPVDLQQVTQSCAKAQALNARKAYVTLSCEGSSQMVRGSRQLLDELCQNLCDNAIRYNRPGGSVVLRTGRGDRGAYLEVEDTGIGIAPEHQLRVFERFYRVDKSRSKATGGTGLGLAIVKHCALLHGGSVELHSHPGQGTRIRVWLPPMV